MGEGATLLYDVTELASRGVILYAPSNFLPFSARNIRWCGGKVYNKWVCSHSTFPDLALSRTTRTNGEREVTEVVEQPVLGAKTEDKARFDGPQQRQLRLERRF